MLLENTGTMDANPRNLLSVDNPFYLDYKLLRGRYGISIVRTPTLLSLAQLQNFMIATAMSKGWAYFYWSHQDIAVLSNETAQPYQSLYEKIVYNLEALNATMGPDTPHGQRWVGRFYKYDHLTLINVDAVRHVGGWDPFIPYYNSDCDWYERSRLSGYPIDEEEPRVADIFDLATHVPDPETRFFPAKDEVATLNSKRYQDLKQELERRMAEKNKTPEGRNTWQDEQKGGHGQPWTYNPKGFQSAWWAAAGMGRGVYNNKWGTGVCGLIGAGKTLDDEWAN
ncbi:hypothetical protein AA313_de0202764 [Arthrobotrys entomopaga]|nr:hypothetical protein AA313_de0202764 [Arthrobotrys entomopaga]